MDADDFGDIAPHEAVPQVRRHRESARLRRAGVAISVVQLFLQQEIATSAKGGLAMTRKGTFQQSHNRMDTPFLHIFLDITPAR